MIFRATQKMASKLRIACSPITDGYPTMVEWYCNVVVLRRRQFFLFIHAPSLFSLWTPAAGLHRDGFGAMFRRGAIDTLNDYGFSNGDAARIIDDGPDVFAKAVDRRVIGSMVDYAKMLRHAVEYEGGFEHLASGAMNDIANECPMSAIGMESPVDYLRQILRAETPHNIAVHRTGARVARSGR